MTANNPKSLKYSSSSSLLNHGVGRQGEVWSFFSESDRKLTVVSGSLTTRDLRSHSHSKAEMLLAGVPGTCYPPKHCCKGQEEDMVRAWMPSLSTVMVRTVSAEDTLTISAEQNIPDKLGI